MLSIDSFHFIGEYRLERIGIELVASAFIELILELHPMKSECMQETFQCVHQHKHTESEREKYQESKP